MTLSFDEDEVKLPLLVGLIVLLVCLIFLGLSSLRGAILLLHSQRLLLNVLYPSLNHVEKVLSEVKEY